MIDEHAGPARRLATCLALAAGIATGLPAPGAQAGPLLGYTLLKDLDGTAGLQSSDPSDFVAWNGRVWFGATSRGAGRELFVTDGSAAGTYLARDFAGGPVSSNARPLGIAGGRLIVEADDGVIGPQLWAISDEGIPPERLSSFGNGTAVADRFAQVGERLILSLSSGLLFSTDGTPAGSFGLDSALGGYAPDASVARCTVGNSAFYLARDPQGGKRLMRTDGTPGGSSPVAAVPFAQVDDALVLDGRCYLLFGQLFGSSWALWSSDGTEQGTAQVAAASDWASPGLTQLGGALYVAQSKRTQPARAQLLRYSPGAAQPEVVLELPTGYIGKPATVAGRIAFAAGYDVNGTTRTGIWFGDGTDAGTTRVYPTQPSQPQIGGTPIASLNDSLIFQGQDEGVRIDATGAATPAPGRAVFDGRYAVAFGDRLVGYGNGARGTEPWITDGSVGGTHEIVDLRPGTADGLAFGDPGTAASPAVASNGGTLFFTAPAAGTFYGPFALWRTDGTGEGTRKVAAGLLQNDTVDSVVATGDGVAFVDRQYGDRTGRVMRVNAALDAASALSPAGGNGSVMSTGSGVVYLVDGDHLAGSVDGSSPGQVVWPSFGGPDAWSIGHISGAAVFVGGADRSIWRSDGTAPGTYVLAGPGWTPPTSGVPAAMFGGRLYFIRCETSTYCALMVTDGSAAGTALVRSLPLERSDVLPGAIAVLGNRFVFAINDAQLWASDGTPGGTDLLRAIDAERFSSLAVAGGKAHLTFDCPSLQQCKFGYLVSDGTPSGTRAVDLPAGLTPTSTVMAPVAGEAVVFSCRSAATGEELCRAEPDGSGARLLADTRPGFESSNPRLLGVTTDAVYVKADDGLHGYEPWVVKVLSERIFSSGFEAGE